VPTAGPREVLVRVLGVGICASDIKCYTGAPLFWGDERRQGYCQPPIIPGHEFVGEVVALGEEAGQKRRLAVGDRVISEQIVPCWECRFCRRGQYWMCDRKPDVYGFRQRTPGAMAEYMIFPADAIVHRVPTSLTLRQAVYIEPMACAIHAVQRGDIQLSDTVVIAGLGPIGMGMVQIARLKSPGLLIALDMKPKRLALARTLGADLAIDVSEGNAIQQVLDLTGGYGCDVYIEATGAAPAVNQGLQMIRKLGTFVEFSVHSKPTPVDWSIIGDVKELNIHGAHLGPYCYPLAIEYLRKGVIDGKALVSHVLPMARFQEALEIAHQGDDSMKVVLVP